MAEGPNKRSRILADDDEEAVVFPHDLMRHILTMAVPPLTLRLLCRRTRGWVSEDAVRDMKARRACTIASRTLTDRSATYVVVRDERTESELIAGYFDAYWGCIVKEEGVLEHVAYLIYSEVLVIENCARMRTRYRLVRARLLSPTRAEIYVTKQ